MTYKQNTQTLLKQILYNLYKRIDIRDVEVWKIL